MKSWDMNVQRHWDDAIELGLVSNLEITATEKRMEKLAEVNRLFLKNGLENVLSTPNFAHTNERLKDVTTREIKWQKIVDGARREIQGLEQMAQRGLDLKDAVKKEKSRIVNFEWLKAKIGGNNECVVCGSKSNQLVDVVARLDIEVNRVDNFARALFESPVVDKEIDAAKQRLLGASSELHSARVERAHLRAIDNATKDSLSKVYVLMGRIQSALAAFATSNSTDELSHRINIIAEELKGLNEYFINSDRAKRERTIDAKLNSLIEFYADEFNLERRGEIRLDKTELTLSFQAHEKAKKEYLWEVGSGANWMGYHIATFLALHELLSSEELCNSPVFRFLVIDQPSQVYFPSAVSGANILDSVDGDIEKLKADRNEDIEATKRIFEMLSLGLKRSKNQFQIIVLEHADKSIWGHCEDTVEAADWKGLQDGLIPKEWILRKAN
jgi:hypothetical protein